MLRTSNRSACYHSTESHAPDESLYSKEESLEREEVVDVSSDCWDEDCFSKRRRRDDVDGSSIFRAASGDSVAGEQDE